MAKKTGGQNPVDEAYLRSLMAGGAFGASFISGPFHYRREWQK
ncbi:Conjugative transposon protein TraB [Bacteroides xylanisolvens SD CC 1b]|uniref:Conjugative transposon protein TraB n=1 Tax=Bacteroides xylanisolvens SD CC 1b TaxID=702447 RepID=D4VJD1_9BACE|nr:conserved domain protein [Bacteroides xylanisolvens SD CC 1b]CDM02474.1 Conjugative transposon protein TraB [Bacteroides xylanisolvens SD CC 1b]